MTKQVFYSGARYLSVTSGAALKALLTEDAWRSLPEAVQGMYEKQQSGDSTEYVLSVDDKDFKTRINEFRSNNVTLMKQVDDMKQMVERFKDIDPEKAKAALTKLQEIEDKQLMDAGQVDELVARRTERMRQDYDGQVKTLTKNFEDYKGKYEAAEKRLSILMVDGEISRAIGKVGTPAKGAMSDILSRARNVWEVRDGKMLAKDEDGNVRFGKDGKEPMTPDEWAQVIVQEAPHLFEGSGGGGAGGASGGSRSYGGNKQVSAGDREAFSRNLEKIAKGEVRVVR